MNKKYFIKNAKILLALLLASAFVIHFPLDNEVTINFRTIPADLFAIYFGPIIYFCTRIFVLILTFFYILLLLFGRILDNIYYKKLLKAGKLDDFSQYKNKKLDQSNQQYHAILLLPNKKINLRSLHTVGCEVEVSDNGLLIEIYSLDELKEHFPDLDETYNYLIPYNKITNVSQCETRVYYDKYKVLTLNITNGNKIILLIWRETFNFQDAINSKLI